MNWAKVTLEVLNLDAGGVVELVQLQVLSPTHEYLLVEEQGGGVGRAGDAHLLDLVQGVRPQEDDLVPRGQGQYLPVLGQLHASDLIRGDEAPAM